MITATYHNMLNIVNKLFGGLGSKNLKTYDKIVKKINDFETEISKLDDQGLKNKTQYFKNQLVEKQKTIAIKILIMLISINNRFLEK